MPRSSYQEGASSRPAWAGCRRLSLSAVSLLALLAIAATTASAAGPLYAVPSHPPSQTESVGFTNALNHRVRHLPAPLNPPRAQSPEEVEARVQALERGVVIERVSHAAPRGGSKPSADRPSPKPEPGMTAAAAEDPGDQAPLSAAFLAAGVLALVGLLFSVRGRHSRPAPQS